MTSDEIKEQLNWVFNHTTDKKAITRQLGEGIMTRIFVGKDTMLSFVRIAPHSKGSVHKHPEEQWGVLLEGSCTRIQDNKEIQMEVGDFWYSPPNTSHGVRTEDDAALILDIFSPPRPDYVPSE